jgi:hypothetical protein
MSNARVKLDRTEAHRGLSPTGDRRLPVIQKPTGSCTTGTTTTALAGITGNPLWAVDYKGCLE